MNPPGLQLLVVLPHFAQLQLEPRPLLGHRVQSLPGVGQLGLVGGLQARQLPGHLRLGLGDAQTQAGVLRLQGAHLVDVDGQTVVEVGEILLLLQPGDAVGGQRGASASRSVFGCRHFTSEPVDEKMSV